MEVPEATQSPQDPAVSRLNVADATPAMARYIEIKHANVDCLLFYRMGDFYELFFDDALVAARALGIALTTRGKHRGRDIPMAGVPVHAADDYLQKLISLGHKIAVCEQVETVEEAKLRGNKAVVRREVVRLITPGTVTEEGLLDSRESSHLMVLALAPSRRRKAAGGSRKQTGIGLAWIDLSTGTFMTRSLEPERLADEIKRLEPREIVIPDTEPVNTLLPPWTANGGPHLTRLAETSFELPTARRHLAEFFETKESAISPEMGDAETCAAGVAVAYIARTQMGAKPALQFPIQFQAERYMQLDAATIASLELTSTQSGKREGSFLTAIRQTLTPAGHRLLAEWITAPLCRVSEIEARQEIVTFLSGRPSTLRELRTILDRVPDIGRALSRLLLKRGGPRDLGALGSGLLACEALLASFRTWCDDPLAPAKPMADLCEPLSMIPFDLARDIASAVCDNPPLTVRDGGFVRTGYNAKLDRLLCTRIDGRRSIAELQQAYAKKTGVKNLRIRNNNVLGYFVEVRVGAESQMLDARLDGQFRHRQTLASAVRFTSEALESLEAEIGTAEERARALELEIFRGFLERLRESSKPIGEAITALAQIDCLQGFAQIAVRENWRPPRIEAGTAFEIVGGRHPVVERALSGDEEKQFVANDCNLGGLESDSDTGRIWLLSGPNMGGKSTFLRQNALIAILAQAGAHVPAKRARIGVIDRVFSRVGASDDLARGRSTFMVEMMETAHILRHATNRSFVILDEIGRGTSTYDGLSIAWAVVEHLHAVNRCRTIFATHFHELQALADQLPRLDLMHVTARQWKNRLIFLYQLTRGAASRSYGVQVAKLAGIPSSVVGRAREILQKLENPHTDGGEMNVLASLPLFSDAAHSNPLPPSPREDVGHPNCPICAFARSLSPNELTPRQAMQALYDLEALLDSSKEGSGGQTGTDGSAMPAVSRSDSPA